MDTLAEKKRSLTARGRTWTAAAGTLAKKKKRGTEAGKKGDQKEQSGEGTASITQAV